MLTRVLVAERVPHPFRDLRHSLPRSACPSLRIVELARPLRDDDSTEPGEALENSAVVESRRGRDTVFAERVRVGEVTGLDQRSPVPAKRLDPEPTTTMPS